MTLRFLTDFYSQPYQRLPYCSRHLFSCTILNASTFKNTLYKNLLSLGNHKCKNIQYFYYYYHILITLKY